MVVRNLQPKILKESIVDMAIAALDGNPNVMDLPMQGFDPSPTALDLEYGEETEIFSNPGCSCSVVDARGRRARDAGQGVSQLD